MQRLRLQSLGRNIEMERYRVQITYRSGIGGYGGNLQLYCRTAAGTGGNMTELQRRSRGCVFCRNVSD